MIVNTRKRPPRRTKKEDRLLNAKANAQEIRIDFLLTEMTKLTDAMNQKWGIDRLIDLVSDETRQRYAQAVANLWTAFDEQDEDGVKEHSQVCLRGLQFLDQEAERLGNTELPDCFDVECDDFHAVVVTDNRIWPVIKQKRPDVRIYNTREVAYIIDQFEQRNGVLTEIKDHFKGAEILEIKTRKDTEHDDPIPF